MVDEGRKDVVPVRLNLKERVEKVEEKGEKLTSRLTAKELQEMIEELRKEEGGGSGRNPLAVMEARAQTMTEKILRKWEGPIDIAQERQALALVFTDLERQLTIVKDDLQEISEKFFDLSIDSSTGPDIRNRWLPQLASRLAEEKLQLDEASYGPALGWLLALVFHQEMNQLANLQMNLDHLIEGNLIKLKRADFEEGIKTSQELLEQIIKVKALMNQPEQEEPGEDFPAGRIMAEELAAFYKSKVRSGQIAGETVFVIVKPLEDKDDKREWQVLGNNSDPVRSELEAIRFPAGQILRELALRTIVSNILNNSVQAVANRIISVQELLPKERPEYYQINMGFAMNDNCLTLSFTDDGQGFSPGEISGPVKVKDLIVGRLKAGKRVGMGLRGIAGAAIFLGGEVVYERLESGGMKVTVTIPSEKDIHL